MQYPLKKPGKCWWFTGTGLHQPRKFKGGIGSLFDPVLTLWGGGHIGSSRMEQSYCTSGFFRQHITACNHSNYQPTPKRWSIIAYGKRKNARRNKCVAVGVICFIFLAAPFYALQTFPGKAQLFSHFFPFLSAVIDMSDPWMYPEHRKVRYVFCIGLLYLFIC